MSKLQIIPRYTKDGTKKVGGYKLTISKGSAEIAGFDENTQLKVIADKGKLIVQKA